VEFSEESDDFGEFFAYKLLGNSPKFEVNIGKPLKMAEIKFYDTDSDCEKL